METTSAVRSDRVRPALQAAYKSIAAGGTSADVLVAARTLNLTSAKDRVMLRCDVPLADTFDTAQLTRICKLAVVNRRFFEAQVVASECPGVLTIVRHLRSPDFDTFLASAIALLHQVEVWEHLLIDGLADFIDSSQPGKGQGEGTNPVVAQS